MKDSKNKNIQKLQREERYKSAPKPMWIILPVIISALYVPNLLPIIKNMAGIQVLIAIFLAPLYLLGLWVTYFTGLTLMKYKYPNTRSAIFYVLLLIILCAIICTMVEVLSGGYPIKMCFDFCQNVEITDAILCYFLANLVMFVPAFIGIIKYKNWTLANFI